MADVERNLSGLYVAKAGPLVAQIVKAIDPADPTKGVEVLISTAHRDRDGDSVVQQKMATKNYIRNKAPIFWGHESRGLPIGTTVKLRLEKLADGVWGRWATPKLATEIPEYPLPRIVRDLLAINVCGPSSIGFMVGEVDELPDSMLTPEELAMRKAGRSVWGKLIRTSELLEWSFVGIPANPNVDITQAGLDRERVEMIHEVAARHLSGGALKDFVRPLAYKESVCVGCLPIKEAPERVRDLAASLGSFGETDDDFADFDLTEKAADPAPAVAALPIAISLASGVVAQAKNEKAAREFAEPPPVKAKSAPVTRKAFAVGDRVQVRPGMEHESEHAGLAGTVAEVSGTAIGIRFDGMDEVHRWYIASELEPADGAGMSSEPSADMGDAMEECTDACRTCTSACSTCTTACTECTAACMACVESCKACVEACVQMMQAMAGSASADGAAPMSMASFAAEVRKTLADHATQVERIQVEVWSLEQRKALDAPKTKSCGCTKAATTAPAEATPDPAPVAKDANTPASAAEPPSSTMDPGLMERVLRAGFTAAREKHLGIVRLPSAG